MLGSLLEGLLFGLSTGAGNKPYRWQIAVRKRLEGATSLKRAAVALSLTTGLILLSFGGLFALIAAANHFATS